MSLTYSTYISTIANLTVYSESDADFVQIMPSAIDYAEDRVYRELNLLATIVRNSSSTLTANSRNFALPTDLGVFQTVTEINVITPSSASVISGTRNPLAKASLSFLDFLYPTEAAPSTPSVPTLYAPVNNTTIAVGAAPDAAYPVEVVGTIQPTPLSSGNPTTYLTTYLPDLFVAASMVFMSGFMRNFGAQADDPKMAVSWEGEYQKLFASADQLETRRRYNQMVNEPNQVAPV